LRNFVMLLAIFLWRVQALNCAILCLNPELEYVNSTYVGPMIDKFCGNADVMAFVDPSTSPLLRDGNLDEGGCYGRLYTLDSQGIGKCAVRIDDVVYSRALRTELRKGLPKKTYLVPRTADDVEAAAALADAGAGLGTFDVVIEASCPLGDFVDREKEAQLVKALLKAGGVLVQNPPREDATFQLGTQVMVDDGPWGPPSMVSVIAKPGDEALTQRVLPQQRSVRRATVDFMGGLANKVSTWASAQWDKESPSEKMESDNLITRKESSGVGARKSKTQTE